MAQESTGDRTLDVTALKALAHPLRVQLLDALSAYGPSTASLLAERFEESSGSTSYHLRQLERHGFVREVGARGVGRERWWERVPEPIRVDVDLDGDPAQRAAGELIVAEWQRSRATRLREFLAHGREDLGAEWIAASLVSTANLKLTKQQATELHLELAAVADRFVERYRDQKAVGARPFQIHLDVFPLIDGVVQTGSGDVGGSEESRDK
jgi:DNA-binding transcriptional ArsR family regulator